MKTARELLVHIQGRLNLTDQDMSIIMRMERQKMKDLLAGDVDLTFRTFWRLLDAFGLRLNVDDDPRTDVEGQSAMMHLSQKARSIVVRKVKEREQSR